MLRQPCQSSAFKFGRIVFSLAGNSLAWCELKDLCLVACEIHNRARVLRVWTLKSTIVCLFKAVSRL